MLAIHWALAGLTGSEETSAFQTLSAGNIGHEAAAGSGVAAGAGRPATSSAEAVASATKPGVVLRLTLRIVGTRNAGLTAVAGLSAPAVGSSGGGREEVLTEP